MLGDIIGDYLIGRMPLEDQCLLFLLPGVLLLQTFVPEYQAAEPGELVLPC